MKKIAIMVDSAADITDTQAKENGLFVVRMPILLDTTEILENDDITDAEFMQKMREGCVCKTSQPTLGSIIHLWQQLLKDYDEVIYIPLSKGISGTYHSASAAARNFDGRVTVVDSNSACYPIQMVAKEAKKMVEKGYSSSEIKQTLEEKAEMWAVLLPDDLQYLKRGGRISSAAAALASLLKIVPLLKVEEGKIDVLGKVRTKRKALEEAVNKATAVNNVEDYWWVIIEADNLSGAKELKELLQPHLVEDVAIVPFRAVIVSHVGPGTLAIGRVKKFEY